MIRRLETRSAQEAEGAPSKAGISPSRKGIGLSEAASRKLVADATEKVDAVYGEIREVVLHYTGDPSLKDRLAPLRRKLAELEEAEAEAMECRLRSQLVFDPEEGKRLLERAESLLRVK